jgi:hypothetical protein
MKCVTCLSKGEDKEAEIIWRGYSFCIKHGLEYAKEEQVEWNRLFGKRKKQTRKLKELNKSLKEKAMKIAKNEKNWI